MAKTFKRLPTWQIGAAQPSLLRQPNLQSKLGVAHEDDPGKQPPAKPIEEQHRESSARLRLKELHYNIQIVLPETRDVAVFDAIFESLRKPPA